MACKSEADRCVVRGKDRCVVRGENRCVDERGKQMWVKRRRQVCSEGKQVWGKRRKQVCVWEGKRQMCG